MRRLSLPRSGGERDTKGLAVSLGKNIKRLRTMVGLRTQKALTELLGIPQSQVSDWENNRYTVLEISTLIKLAKVLHCSVDELLAGVDPDYDWNRQGGAVGAVPAQRWPDIPVVAEGDTLPDGITWDERAQERPEVLRWLSRPGDLGDPKAYGIQIRGDSMLPAYRPNMIVIVSPEFGGARRRRGLRSTGVGRVSGQAAAHVQGCLLAPAVQSGPQRARGGARRGRGDARNCVLASRVTTTVG